MSIRINEQTLITSSNGETYEDYQHFIELKPLDTGRLFYVMLRRAAGEDTDLDIEVYWNHFNNTVTGVISGRNSEFEVSFVDMQMARTDKLAYLRDLIERMKEAVPFP